MNMQTIGQMSCNPAMGGITKGQIVEEIDAMGGFSRNCAADKSAIQFKMLQPFQRACNVVSSEHKIDKMKFAEEWRLYSRKHAKS